VNNYENADVIARVSRGLGKVMPGLDVHLLKDEEVLRFRGN